MQKEPRLIKKYPNRRLYDTAVSRYITLEEVKELVLSGDDFIVLDKKSNKDITRSILLQVISEQEEGADPMFSKDYLRQVIRFYGDNLQSSVSNYMEHSLDYFVEQRQSLQDRLKDLVGNNPLSRLRDMAREDSQKVWQNIRKEVVDNLESVVDNIESIVSKHDDDKETNSKDQDNQPKVDDKNTKQ